MTRPRDPVFDLIASVSDGVRVDWARALQDSRDPAERRLLEALRLLETVAERQGEPAAPRPPVLSLGRHGQLEVRAHIASGAHADVYRAVDTRLHRELALKVLAPDAGRWRGAAHGSQDSYLEEARRLARVRHPNVIVIYAAEPVDGQPALWMEHIQGQTLADLVATRGRLGAGEVASIGRELCGALAAVHGAGLVHEDVKAQNVMREDGGRIVLMDFGTGGATPMAMAPELFDGAMPSTRSDLYALGVLLFHVATGEYPVTGRSLDDLREAHRAGLRTRLLDLRPELPAALVQAIERALAPAPAERFETAGEMGVALGAPPPVAASSRGSGASGARRVARGWNRRLVWEAIAIAAVIAVGSWAVPRLGRKPLGSAPASSSALDAATLSERAPGSPAAIVPFSIRAGFFRGDAQRQPLHEGARVAVGDSISLQVEASDSLYVYVIDRDDQGEAYLLFPSARLRPDNPLPPGAAHTLPGTRDGRPFFWQITTAGGHEHLLVLASRDRLKGLESLALALARPVENAPLAFARVPDAALVELRGMGGYAAGRTADADAGGRDATADLYGLASALSDSREEARGVWIRKRTLVHQTP